MYTKRPLHSRGFSLVELVIVVVIIGILAAVAIPRISRGTRGASESALQSDLAVLRHAIELYASEHSGVFPGASDTNGFGAPGSENAFRNQLLMYTDLQGGCAAQRDGTHVFGPYLRQGIPELPVGGNAGSDRVSTSNIAPRVSVGDNTGWVYDYTNGEIIANSDDPDSTGNRTYDQY